MSEAICKRNLKKSGAYCMKLLPEKRSGSFLPMHKVNGKFMLTRVFRFYQSFFSGKSFMQWAPGVLAIESDFL